MQLKFLVLWLLLSRGICFAQSSNDILVMADKAYTAGDKEKAKTLYLQAAVLNNAEAHFALYYQFILPPKESRYHLFEAAKAGHVEAVKHTLDALFFRATNLIDANPELAISIYKEAKKQNPSLTFFEEEAEIAALSECIEAGPFDVKGFIKKYNISNNPDDYGSYTVWEMAEEASRGGRFGSPNPKLVFQLVCRGGSVPAEVMAAVHDTYKNWKENKEERFNLCDYITSGIGMGYCANRMEDAVDKEIKVQLDSIIEHWDSEQKALLQQAYSSAELFISNKAEYEEGHGGTGRRAWLTESVIAQKIAFVDLITATIAGVDTVNKIKFQDSDRTLNQVYKQVLGYVRSNRHVQDSYFVSEDNMRIVQRSWIPYRDNIAKLLTQLLPRVTAQTWKDWLTQIRIEQLRGVLDYR